jgi:hypothetical protein
MTAAEIIAEHPDLPLEELGRTAQLNLRHRDINIETIKHSNMIFNAVRLGDGKVRFFI